MRKKLLAFVVIASLAGIGCISGSITLATASYTYPTESYSFDGTTTSLSTFSVGHYFHGGAGTVGDPYLITNPIEMRNLSKLQNYGIIGSAYYYKLKNSFNWYGANIESIGTTAKPFLGNFNGNGMTISGIKIDANSTSAGLFGVVSGANIHDLVLSGPTINCSVASTKAGFAVGSASSASTVTNVYVHGGSASFDRRAIVKASSSASVTMNAPFIVGNTTNFTVTTSGFVASVDTTSTVYTSVSGGGSSSVSISASGTKYYYGASTGIVVA